ncbi:MAG: hypothetical protein IJA30_04830 [Bacilli bacterium]|nr:hypothetical protein [Bacilli bacterium]
MLKKISQLIIVLLIMVTAIPVFAKESISVESIKLVSQSENLNVTDTKNMNVNFNDLDQYVKYEVTLKNNTDKKLFVNELKVDNSSQDFIHYVLDDSSIGKEISSGKTTKVNIFVKTLEIEGAGRNTNDNINLRFMLGDSIKNPATGNNKVELIVSILLISLLIFMVCYKKDTKVKVSIIVITLMLVGTTSVLADDVVTAELEGNVSYSSQNLMQSSGTTVTNNTIDYSTSEDVWKYYDKVKNVNISSVSKFEKDYVEEFDLTIGDKSRVKGYLVKSDAEGMYDLHIASRGVIYAPANSTALFSFPKVEKINGLENVVFEETKTFTGMFMGNEEMTEANVESIDFSNAEDTSHMFTKCYEIEVEEETLNIPEEAKSENTFIMYLYDEVKKDTITDKNTDFSTTPITGKYFIESTKNDEYPVYYYRGAITNNNVKFANFCWKMVRTTETGGVKLIYNGVPSSNGSCNNTGTASQLSNKSKFNEDYDSPAYVGYMYNLEYSHQYINTSNRYDIYTYGNDVEWDGENYILKDTTKSNAWNNVRKTLAKKYHYTCFNYEGKCPIVYYITYFGDTSKIYYINLAKGKDIEEVKKDMFTNKKDSLIKTTIDSWYKTNLIKYTNKLEDTVWCNDRTIYSGSLKSKDTNAGVGTSQFGSHERNYRKKEPNIKCSTTNDSFTVSPNKGNGDLTYPVGLLTADEYTLSGSIDEYGNSYLNTGETQWTLSPYAFNMHSAYNFYLDSTYTLDSSGAVSYYRGVRPAVSLKAGTDYISGNGTVSNPYIVE